MRKNLLFSFLLLFSATLFAQTTVWNPAANPATTGLWSEAANWTNGLPANVVGAKAVFNVPDALACTVNSTVEAYQIVMGDNGPGDTLIIEAGGKLTTGDVWSAIGRSGVSTLIVKKGATVSFGNHMFIGQNAGGNANVILDGGIINVGQMFGLDFNQKGLKDTLFLKGGLLNLANLDGAKSIGDSSQIVITGGMIKIAGDHLAKINNFINANKIVGADTAFFDAAGNYTAVIAPALATTEWTPMAGGTNFWSDRLNWMDFHVPDSNKVKFKRLTECVYDDTATTVAIKIVVGDNDEGGILTVKNGTLTASNKEWSAVGWNAPGTLNVEEGATFNFQHHMWIGWTANGPGVVNINGGTVTCSKMFGLGGFETGAGKGIVNLKKGTLKLTQLHESQSIYEGSYIDIEQGELVLPTTETDKAINYVKEGKIKGYAGKGYVSYRIESGKIYFTATDYTGLAAVVKTTPANGAVDVSVASDVVIEFFDDMDIASVESAITMSPAFSNVSYSWSQVSNTVLTISADDLSHETEYTVSIAATAADIHGNKLAEAYSFSFVTDTAQTYKVTFTVSDNSGVIEGAVVDFQSTQVTTNVDGVAEFIGIEAVTDAAYTVTKAGYEDVSGTITVVDADVAETVLMTPTGINLNTLNKVSMYPNPFSNTLTLEHLDDVSSVVVCNILGQAVLNVSTKGNRVTLNTKNLNSGIYLITIIDVNNNSRTERFIKK